jgi:hypothetical protein
MALQVCNLIAEGLTELGDKACLAETGLADDAHDLPAAPGTVAS